MKNVLSVVLAVLIVILSCGSIAFASSADETILSVLTPSIDDVLAYFKALITNYTDSVSKKIEAARTFYFYIILNDKYSSGKTVFDDTGYKFTNEILDFYFEQYSTTKKSIFGSASDIYNSEGDIFLQAAGFVNVPWSLSMCSFGTIIDNGSAALGDYDKVNFKQYFQTMLARYLLEHGETATDPAPGKNGLEIAPAYVTSDELIEGLYKDNSSYSPKSETWKLTWRNNPQGQFYELSGLTYPLNYIGLSNDSKGYMSFSDLYLLPYFRDNDGNEYYSQYQLHVYLKEWDDPNSDIYLACDIYSYLTDFTGTLVETASDLHLLDMSMDNMPYKIALDYPQYGAQEITGRFFKTNSDYATHKATSFTGWVSNHDKTVRNNIFKVFTSDLTDYRDLSINTVLRFDRNLLNYTSDPILACFNNPEKNDGVTDVGFLASSELIRFTYSDIDISKIGKGQIVTINGDTIYNYNITNPETGDSSKFGDYITNNYTYITNNNGGSSGGTVGGKVEVGGKIDVGGTVGVDVNVNVNGGGNSSLPDIGDISNNLPEAPQGFLDYLASLFSFLPTQVWALIVGAISAAVLCRVWGR